MVHYIAIGAPHPHHGVKQEGTACGITEVLTRATCTGKKDVNPVNGLLLEGDLPRLAAIQTLATGAHLRASMCHS